MRSGSRAVRQTRGMRQSCVFSGIERKIGCGAEAARNGGMGMAEYYLLKTEPSEYSFADLQKDGSTEWDGVANPTAVKHLREMHSGEQLIIYETGDHKCAVGTATLVSV